MIINRVETSYQAHRSSNTALSDDGNAGDDDEEGEDDEEGDDGATYFDAEEAPREATDLLAGMVQAMHLTPTPTPRRNAASSISQPRPSAITASVRFEYNTQDPLPAPSSVRPAPSQPRLSTRSYYVVGPATTAIMATQTVPGSTVLATRQQITDLVSRLTSRYLKAEILREFTQIGFDMTTAKLYYHALKIDSGRA